MRATPIDPPCPNPAQQVDFALDLTAANKMAANLLLPASCSIGIGLTSRTALHPSPATHTQPHWPSTCLPQHTHLCKLKLNGTFSTSLPGHTYGYSPYIETKSVCANVLPMWPLIIPNRLRMLWANGQYVPLTLSLHLHLTHPRTISWNWLVIASLHPKVKEPRDEHPFIDLALIFIRTSSLSIDYWLIALM